MEGFPAHSSHPLHSFQLSHFNNYDSLGSIRSEPSSQYPYHRIGINTCNILRRHGFVEKLPNEESTKDNQLPESSTFSSQKRPPPSLRPNVPLRSDQRLNKLSAYLTRRHQTSPRLLHVMSRFKNKRTHGHGWQSSNAGTKPRVDTTPTLQSSRPIVSTEQSWLITNEVDEALDELMSSSGYENKPLNRGDCIDSINMNDHHLDAEEGYDNALEAKHAHDVTSDAWSPECGMTTRGEINDLTPHCGDSEGSAMVQPMDGSYDHRLQQFGVGLADPSARALKANHQAYQTDEGLVENDGYSSPMPVLYRGEEYSHQQSMKDDRPKKVKSRTKMSMADGCELVGRSVFFRSALVPYGGRPPPSSTLATPSGEMSSSHRNGIATKIKKFFIVGAGSTYIAIREYLRSGTKGVELDTALYVTKKENIRLAQGRPTKRYEAIIMEEVIKTATHLDYNMDVIMNPTDIEMPDTPESHSPTEKGAYWEGDSSHDAMRSDALLQMELQPKLQYMSSPDGSEDHSSRELIWSSEKTPSLEMGDTWQ